MINQGFLSNKDVFKIVDKNKNLTYFWATLKTLNLRLLKPLVITFKLLISFGKQP